MNLSLSVIRTDGGTQPRERLDDAVIDEYADAMRAGDVFPPVVIFFDGTDYWLADGFHRLHAASRVHAVTIGADVRQGTLDDAKWYSYSVNQTHGLRRTNADKRRAVEAALAHPFAGRYSGEQIARHCGVSNATVSRYRESISYIVRDEPPERTVTRNGMTYTMQTGNIGRGNGRTSEPEPEPNIAFEDYVAQREAAEPPPAPEPVELAQLSLPQKVHEVGHLVKVIHGDARDDHGLSGIHLVITSPPYNVGVDYSTHNDNLSVAEYGELLRRTFEVCGRSLVAGGRIAVIVPFGVGRNPWQPLAAKVQDWLGAAGFTLRGLIVWDKGTTGNRTTWGSFRLPSDPSLRDTTEAIIVAHKERSRLPLPENVVLHDEKGSHTGWLADSDEFMGMAQDHWQIAPESAQRIGHPAPFPVALAERLLRFYGYPGCHVLDPFAGSGTVGVAAVRLNCRATLIDVAAEYCELAVARCEEELSHGRDY